MTGLENIINQIRQDAEEAARHQISQAESEATKVLDSAKLICEKRTADILKTGEAKNADLLLRARSAAQLDARKKLLTVKQELISTAVASTKAELEGLDAPAYFEMLLKLAEKYSTPEAGELCLSKADLARLPANFETRLHTKGKVTVGKEPVNIKNGFLLIYGGIDVNCTLDALFADAADDLQDTLADILFE